MANMTIAKAMASDITDEIRVKHLVFGTGKLKIHQDSIQVYKSHPTHTQHIIYFLKGNKMSEFCVI